MSLVSFQGQGGGRIPIGGFSYDVSRQELSRIVDSMPTEACRAMHIAAREGDNAEIDRVIAATGYHT